MGPKKNKVLGDIEARCEARFRWEKNAQMDIFAQIYADAFCLACHEVFQMGPGRAKAAMGAYKKAVNDICNALVKDSEDDSELTYFWADLDRALKKIVGEENFLPNEVRYRIGRRSQ